MKADEDAILSTFKCYKCKKDSKYVGSNRDTTFTLELARPLSFSEPETRTYKCTRWRRQRDNDGKAILEPDKA